MKTFSMSLVLVLVAASAAQARGPARQPWVIYPAKTMASCQAGTAMPTIAARCDELLGAYGRELEACVPMRKGGPLMAEQQIALQKTDPDCAAAAAAHAAKSVF